MNLVGSPALPAAWHRDGGAGVSDLESTENWQAGPKVSYR